MGDSFLRPIEIAKLLGYKDARPVYNLIHKNKLPASKISHRNICVKKKDFENFINNKKIKQGK